jgi:glutamate-1-semialdehyde 2,1-aminomutase
VTGAAAADTIVVPYNDLAAVDEAFEARGEDIACLIVEPVAANMGVVPPAEGFLGGLREACDRAGALLIFDEVITGFRLGRGGAQVRFGITPDLTTLGKILGGGFPLAAFGGRADIMDHLAPAGPVYQAGTLSGNPVAVAAGLAALELLDKLDPYADLEARATELTASLADIVAERALPATINRSGSLFSLFFGDPPVLDYDTARAADHQRYSQFFHGMLEGGVYLPPSGYEGWFLSAAHDDADIEYVLEVIRAVTSRW